MYLRNPASHPAAQIPGALNNPSGYQFGAGGGRKRVRDEEHAEQDLVDNIRPKAAATLSEQYDMIEQPDMTQALMESVEDLQNRLWNHVSSIMETKTGKLFDPKVLESRYHTIQW